MLSVLKYFKGLTNVDTSKLFSAHNSSLAGSKSLERSCKQVQLDCTEFFFTNDAVRESNKFSLSEMQYDISTLLKTNLTTISKNVSDKSKSSGVLQAV